LQQILVFQRQLCNRKSTVSYNHNRNFPSSQGIVCIRKIILAKKRLLNPEGYGDYHKETRGRHSTLTEEGLEKLRLLAKQNHAILSHDALSQAIHSIR
jgi:hypothetical protein